MIMGNAHFSEALPFSAEGFSRGQGPFFCAPSDIGHPDTSGAYTCFEINLIKLAR
jgi:hypothetical protein